MCLPILGCMSGDFGRLRQSLVTDDIHSWLGAEAIRGRHEIPSKFPLTDDERSLRDLAYPLIAPPYDRPRWDSVLDEYGVSQRFSPISGFDVSAYAATLFAEPRRSVSSIYASLIDDIRNDQLRLSPFAAIVRQVTDMDRKRERSLAYVSALTPAEHADAQRRVSENVLIIKWVHRSLIDRVAAYRFALERLVISAPSSMAVEAERQLTLLKMRISQAQFTPVSSTEGASGAGRRPLVAKD